MPKMRNPNGYGSVVKLSGNRRRPYVARKTVGFNDKGSQYRYYEDRKKAMYALAAYNTNPQAIDNQKITFTEVYERWTDYKYTNKGKLQEGMSQHIKHVEASMKWPSLILD